MVNRRGTVTKYNRIRESRKSNRLKATLIAEKLGVSLQYYYDLEKGKRNLSADIAVKLSNIFGVSTDYLLGMSDIPKCDDGCLHSMIDEHIYLSNFKRVTRNVVGEKVYELIMIEMEIED
ncbi:helix-turn-helix domain-containing protein [Desertibacillus haloalkaliphilus]|uniref:helix-turn-helix domain-containing protein n=1 Tax=Desertibacillus haloalkaliphilus TaxID=1328930 RepID=UPI001C280CF5|nr:helix-turn-helix transcriptional regulator [Desertibacillus haloalkaliphilus]MBU8908179.1 helix-turn-helix domain-containing protein [Desertibacillus haloalkaliphilus]